MGRIAKAIIDEPVVSTKDQVPTSCQPWVWTCSLIAGAGNDILKTKMLLIKPIASSEIMKI